MAPFTLTFPEGIFDYLKEVHPHLHIERVLPLSGGNANFVYRVYVDPPAKFDNTLHKTFIFKYSPTYLASASHFPLPVERQQYEANALRYTKDDVYFSPDSDSPVYTRTPILFVHDIENNILLTSDAGIHSRTLKDLLISNDLSLDLAIQIGNSLGDFLGRLHSVGRTSSYRDVFAGHNWARQITAAYYHGRVEQTLSSDLFEPKIELDAETMGSLGQAISEMQNAIHASDETIIMGDFWPGNILVNSKCDDGKISVTVVDWEVVKLGLAGNDVGQFLAEVHLAGVFYPKCTNVAVELIKAFCNAYKRTYAGFSDKLVGYACAQLGAHIITIPPTVDSWKSVDDVLLRQTALEGVKAMVNWQQNDQEYISQTSPVKYFSSTYM